MVQVALVSESTSASEDYYIDNYDNPANIKCYKVHVLSDNKTGDLTLFESTNLNTSVCAWEYTHSSNTNK